MVLVSVRAEGSICPSEPPRECVVYKIPSRRARAWPSASASKGILHTRGVKVSHVIVGCRVINHHPNATLQAS